MKEDRARSAEGLAGCSVRATRYPSRSSRRSLSWLSRFLIEVKTVEWLRRNLSAPAWKPPSVTTASKCAAVDELSDRSLSYSPRQSFSEFCPIYQILPPYDRSAPDLPAVLPRRWRKKVITLYKFGPFLGTPDSSPFVIKTMMLLRLAGVPFREAQGNPFKAPQGAPAVYRRRRGEGRGLHADPISSSRKNTTLRFRPRVWTRGAEGKLPGPSKGCAKITSISACLRCDGSILIISRRDWAATCSARYRLLPARLSNRCCVE